MVAMYLVGAPHPREDRRRLLEQASEREKLVTTVEVLQEILHRYTAIDRRDVIQPAFDALLDTVDEVYPIDLADVTRAKAIVLERPRLSARDALHVAAIERHGVTRIMSFDAGLDTIPGLLRLS